MWLYNKERECMPSVAYQAVATSVILISKLIQRVRLQASSLVQSHKCYVSVRPRQLLKASVENQLLMCIHRFACVALAAEPAKVPGATLAGPTFP